MSFNNLECGNLNARNINTPNTNSNNINAFNVNTTTINGSPYPPSGSGVSIVQVESGAGLPILFTNTLSGNVANLDASNGMSYNAQNGSLMVNNIDFDLNPVNAGFMGIYSDGIGTDILIRNQGVGNNVVLNSDNTNTITVGPTSTILNASSGTNVLIAGSNQALSIQTQGIDTSKSLNIINGNGGNITIGTNGSAFVDIATGNGNIIQQSTFTTMNAPTFYLNDIINNNVISSDGTGINVTSTNGLALTNGSDSIVSNPSNIVITSVNPLNTNTGTFQFTDTAGGNIIKGDGSGITMTSTNGFSMTNNSDTLISNGGSFQMFSPNPIGITGTGVLIANGTNGDAIVTNVAGISITSTVNITVEPASGTGSSGMVLTNIGAGVCAWQAPGTSFNASAPLTDNTGSYNILGSDFTTSKILIDTYTIGAHAWTAPLATDLNAVFPGISTGFTTSLFLSNAGGQDLTINANTGTSVVGRDLIGISGTLYAVYNGGGLWTIYL